MKGHLALGKNTFFCAQLKITRVRMENLAFSQERRALNDAVGSMSSLPDEGVYRRYEVGNANYPYKVDNHPLKGRY